MDMESVCTLPVGENLLPKVIMQAAKQVYLRTEQCPSLEMKFTMLCNPRFRTVNGGMLYHVHLHK